MEMRSRMPELGRLADGLDPAGLVEPVAVLRRDLRQHRRRALAFGPRTSAS